MWGPRFPLLGTSDSVLLTRPLLGSWGIYFWCKVLTKICNRHCGLLDDFDGMGRSDNIDERGVFHLNVEADSYRGIFFFTGPVLLILTAIFEWIMGNFFPMMVCGLFAVFWLSFGVLQ